MATVKVELAHSSLGIVLVAVSESGIRSVQIGEDGETLKRDFTERFRGMKIIAPDEISAAIAKQVADHMDDDDVTIDAPLDIRGTPFQRSVWSVLRDVPRGSTISYTELAARIGRPAAVRAVAHACAENAHAVIIPCHRAVRSDGSLAGYRWGIERKRALLEREVIALASRTV